MNVATAHADLLASAVAGERVALERLLAATRPDLTRYARRHCESQDVEDAVQDALWIIHQRLGTLQSLASFAGWTFRIVKRLCFGIGRANSRHKHVPLFEADAIDAASDSVARWEIVSSIAALPPHYREALILSDVVGHSAQVMAAELGVSLEAAKARLHRARMVVRADLQDAQVSSQQRKHHGVR